MNEDQKEVEERKMAFLKAYEELVKTHEFDFASYPMFVPDGQAGFKITVQSTPIDMKGRSVPSPVMKQE